jgi:hypothetical protein
MAASWRLSSLLQAFNSPTRHRDEILRYFPVAVVASIDGYFRSRMANLIDAGDPFLSSAVAKYPDIKLDMQMAGALATKRVTLGELITYRVSISSFPALIDFVRNVTGEMNFPRDLTGIRPPQIGADVRPPIIGHPDATWRRLEKVFSIGHILCHELAQDIAIDEEETRQLLLSAQAFLKASSTWIDVVIAKRIPARLHKRGRDPRKSISEARGQIEKLIGSVKADSRLQRLSKALSELQGANEAYVSTMRKTWIDVLGKGAHAFAERYSDLEELDTLKVFLSTLASMLMETEFHLMQSEDIDLSVMMEFISGQPHQPQR